MTHLYSGLTVALRNHPGGSGMIDLGLEVEGGFLTIVTLTQGRLDKVIARGKAAQAEAAAAAQTAAAPANG